MCRYLVYTESENTERGKSLLRKIFDPKSLTVFLRAVLLVAIAVLLYKFVDNSDSFYQWLNGKLGEIVYALKPFVFGIALAYIFCPIVDVVEKKWLGNIQLIPTTNDQKAHRFDRLVSLFLVYVVMIASVVIVVIYLGPSMVSGIVDAAVKAPEVYRSFESALMGFSEQGQNSQLIERVLDAFSSAVNQISTQILSLANVAIGSAFSIVSEIIVVLFALIVSAYFIYYKTYWVEYSYRVIDALFGQKVKVRYMLILRSMNHKFIRFIIGKGVASIILGVMCFLILTLMNCPYVVLITVLFAVLNMIPYIGAFLGELVGALLACTVSLPFGGAVFIVLLLLQQFDAFYLSPKLVGDALDMSPVWIIFSVFFFGALFGPLGMFFGSPLMAVVLELVENGLRRKESKRRREEAGHGADHKPEHRQEGKE